MIPLSQNCKFVECIAVTSAGTSTITGTAIDTAGFDGACFLLKIGTAATNNTMKVQQDTASAMSSASDLTGTSVASDATSKQLVQDIPGPLEQHLRCIVARGTSTTIDYGVCILYGARAVPTSMGTTTTVETTVQPVEGTA